MAQIESSQALVLVEEFNGRDLVHLPPRTGHTEETLCLAGDHVRGSVEDVLAHGLQQVVAAIALLAAQRVQDDVHALGVHLAHLVHVVGTTLQQMIDLAGGGQSLVLVLGAHTKDFDVVNGLG